MVKNILFIMCDQLRADYLGCNGHPSISTPNIDALAQRGVNFTRAYCQAPVCGALEGCRFIPDVTFLPMVSTYNNVPLKLEEWTLGGLPQTARDEGRFDRQDAFQPGSSGDSEDRHRSKIFQGNPAQRMWF